MSQATLKIQTKPLPTSRLAVEIDVSAERCQASYEEAITRLSRSVKLAGFRKGKVPRAVLLQQVGSKSIKASALENLLSSVWKDAINQASIEPLCEPEINGGFEALLEDFNPNQPISLTFETDITPTPKLKSTKDLNAEAETIAFDPKKIDELIEQSRNQLATLVPIENRSAKKGDVAVVSFEGSYSDDGSPIEGGKAESMDVDLETGKMIPGFIEGIIGMSIGTEKKIECQFPDDYQDEKAQGRKANFTIKVKELKERELPELDDAFAKQASDQSNMNELRKELETRLKEDTSRRNKKNREDALLKALEEQLEVELPESLIQQEIRQLIEQTARQFAQQGMDVKSIFTPELVNSLMESSREEAKQNLRQAFALKALALAEGIQAEESDIENKYQEVKRELSAEKNIDTEKLRQAVTEDLLKEKLLEWLEQNSKVSEKPQEDRADKPKTEAKAKNNKPKSTSSKGSKT